MQMLLSMEEGECNTNLVLAIGGRQFVPHKIRPHGWKNTTLQFDALFPYPPKEEERSASRSKYIDEEEVISGKEPSSCSNDKLVKARKKLKLTKEQVTLLEDSFREHNTLNTAEKQELADRLNIQSRQVEVWFQNRRARTKLKQIEVDYECLKRCCESLSDENRRLKEELQELKSASPGSPFHKHFLEPAPQLLGVSKCPSCGRMGMGKLVPAVNVSGLLVQESKSYTQAVSEQFELEEHRYKYNT